MSDALSRRDFLQRSAAVGAGVVLIGSTEMLVTAPAAPAGVAGYGPLVPDPAKRLALPAGFHYKVVTEAGITLLESGEPTPRNHDGTGAFRRRGGGTVLVNNHEIRDPFDAAIVHPVPHLEGLTYDPGAAGGATVVEVDRFGNRVSEYVGVAGTATNCAGGVTPWDTWLTCEEIDALAGTGTFQRDHGYVFEVDPFDRGANKAPEPIKALGRFEHEAAVVDPHRGDVYLTEDASKPTGLFYRWEAPRGFRGRRGALRRLGATEGVLAAMKASDSAHRHVPDLSLATAVGTVYSVEWVPVPDRDGRSAPVRTQFADGDVTRSRKLEGAWWGDGGIYVVASFSRVGDGPVSQVHDGQIWFYDPKRGTLTLKLLFTKSPDPALDGAFDGPDNITVSPYGGVLMAEDGEGIQHLVGATGSGATFPVARNDFEGASKDVEFTGPVYSPDARILFANIQEPGVMFAISGPWRRQR